MSIWLIALIIYVVVALGFFAAIQFERKRQRSPLNMFQVIVALFWPVWGAWYLYTLAQEAWERRGN